MSLIELMARIVPIPGCVVARVMAEKVEEEKSFCEPLLS